MKRVVLMVDKRKIVLAPGSMCCETRDNVFLSIFVAWKKNVKWCGSFWSRSCRRVGLDLPSLTANTAILC